MRLFLLSVLGYFRDLLAFLIQSVCVVVALAGLMLMAVAFYAFSHLIPRRVMVIILPHLPR